MSWLSNEWSHQSIGRFMNELINWCMNYFMHWQVYVFRNGWIKPILDDVVIESKKKWMNAWTDEWMNESMIESRNKLILQSRNSWHHKITNHAMHDWINRRVKLCMSSWSDPWINQLANIMNWWILELIHAFTHYARSSLDARVDYLVSSWVH